MSVRTFERRTFGEPLETDERILGGLIAAVAAAGHAALGAAAAVLFYVLLFGL